MSHTLNILKDEVIRLKGIVLGLDVEISALNDRKDEVQRLIEDVEVNIIRLTPELTMISEIEHGES